MDFKSEILSEYESQVFLLFNQGYSPDDVLDKINNIRDLQRQEFQKLLTSIKNSDLETFKLTERKIQSLIDKNSISSFQLENKIIKIIKTINKSKKPDLKLAKDLFPLLKEVNIRKTRSVVRKKVRDELDRLINILRLDVDEDENELIPKDAGWKLAFDWTVNAKVHIIFTVRDGVVVWYEHTCTDKCEKPKKNQKTCNQVFDLILAERKINLSKKDQEKPLKDKFTLILNKIIQGDT